ncbi:hypothetical protein BC936DRAFT_142607, partial [Jimgerdemannia flammicorona]
PASPAAPTPTLTTSTSTANTTTQPDSTLDHLIAQIVDMGFTPAQARTALAATPSGRDVEAAIEILIQDREDLSDGDDRPAELTRRSSATGKINRRNSNNNKNKYTGIRGAERERRRMIDEDEDEGGVDGYTTPDSEDDEHLERRRSGRSRVPTEDQFGTKTALASAVPGTGGSVAGGGGGGMLGDFAARRTQFLRSLSSTVGGVTAAAKPQQGVPSSNAPGRAVDAPNAPTGPGGSEDSPQSAAAAAAAAAAEARQQALKQSKEKLVAGATELGGFLYKGASSLIRGGKERIEKAMGDMQPESGEGSDGTGGVASTGGNLSGGGSGRKKGGIWGGGRGGGGGGGADGFDDEEGGGVRVRGGYERYVDSSDDDDEGSAHRPFWSDDLGGVEEKEKGVSAKTGKESVEEEKARQAQAQREREQKAKKQDVESPYVSPSRRRNPPPPVPSAATKPSLSSSTRSPAPRIPRTIVQASTSQLSTAKAHRTKGNDLFKLGQFGDAERVYTLAIDSLPSRHDNLILLHNNRAAARLKNGDHKACVEDCSVSLDVITPDWVAVAETEGGFREQAIKALLRRATAYEALEKYREAKGDFESLMKIDGGRNKAVNDGLGRCNKAIRLAESGDVDQKVVTPSGTPSRPPALSPSTSTSLNLFDPTPPNPANNPFSSAFNPSASLSSSSTAAAVNLNSPAVAQIRAQTRQQDAEDAERLRVKDQVDARHAGWRQGKEANLRALIASLDLVLWEGAGWKGVKMSELIEPRRCKVVYMKAIAKVHPDKVGSVSLL